MMNRRLPSAFALLLLTSLGVYSASAARPASSDPAPKKGQAASTPETQRRADIYFNLMMGHLYSQEYQESSKAADADRAIEYYKKAYALDPTSAAIGEELAEMYFVSQRSAEAITEVQNILKRDPDNVASRQLLARIYVRSLGALTDTAAQSVTANLAIDQFREIVRLDPADSDSAIWLARLYRLTNQHDKAEQVLRDLLMRDPDNDQGVSQLTQLLLDEDKSQEAIALLQEGIKRSPSGGLYDQLGDAYAQIHDSNSAEEAYRNAIGLEPDSVGHHTGLAETLFDSGKYPDALAEYQKLTEMEPDQANNYLRESEIYRQMNRLDEAEAAVLQARQKAPGSLEVIYNEASIYEAEGRYEDGVRVLSDAVSSVKAQAEAPSNRRTLAILYQVLGQLYGKEENYTAAVSAFHDLAGLGPEEDRRARALIIDSYEKARDMPSALAESQKAVTSYPDDRSLKISQALLYGENNQTDQAAAALRSMLDHSSNDLEIYLNLAQVLEEGQRLDEAESAVQAAEKLATSTSDQELVGFSMAAVYEREKKYDEAEKAFQGVLAINPRSAATLNYYGYMLAERGVRLDEAVGYVQRALAEEPTNASYLDSLGWAYFRQDNYADAEKYLRMAVEGEPHNPTMLSHLGDVYAKTGRQDLAVTQWQKSLDEWHRSLAGEYDAKEVESVEQKLASAKRGQAQPQTPGTGTNQ
jgi:tetratricopeptide (TPR) repeat protein